MEGARSTRKARLALHRGKQWKLGTKKTSGECTSSRPEILEETTKHYKALYTSLSQNLVTRSKQNSEEQIPPILQSEVRCTITELKNGKTPGEDGVWNKHIKQGEELLVQPITLLFNRIIQTEVISEKWLHKKGAKDDLNNYRPISLMSSMYKLFSKVLTRRLTKKLDEQQPNEQARFRTGFNTADHFQTIKQVIEKVQEFKPTALHGLRRLKQSILFR